MEESKTEMHQPVNSGITLLKGLAMLVGSVLALMVAIVSPLGELLFYGFTIFAAAKEKKRSNANK